MFKDPRTCSSNYDVGTSNDRIKGKDGGWLGIKSDGKCNILAKFGFTMIGISSPFIIDQVYGFLDMNYGSDTNITVSGNSGLDILLERKKKPTSAHPGLSFNYPGLVEFSPNFHIFVGLEADDASFSGYVYLRPQSYTPTLDKHILTFRARVYNLC